MENKNLPEICNRASRNSNSMNFNSWSDHLFEFSRMVEKLLGVDSWNPEIALQDNGDELVLSATIPGFDPRDLDIAVHDDRVSIKGDNRWEETREKSGYYQVTQSRRSFYRTIPLPERVKSEKTEAQYNDGVLEVKMIKGKSLVRGFKPSVISREP